MNNGSAKIVELQDARTRYRAEEMRVEDFPSAGAYLKAMRDGRELTIEDVAEKTHIKPAFLEAIEAGDADALPSRPFAIGFVKGYAEALGADPKSVVARFKDDIGVAPTPDLERVLETPVPEETGVAMQRPEMSLFAVALIIVFVIWCAYQITQPRSISRPFLLGDLPASGAAMLGSPLVMKVSAATARGEAASPAIGAVPPALPEVIEARLFERIEPVYPPRCEAGAAASERVAVAFTVTAGGDVSGERVVASSNDCFDRAALNAVRRWVYAPRTIDGVARPAYDQRVEFAFARP